MNKLKIIFAGSPNFAKIVLEKLCQLSPELGFNVVGVLTNPDKAARRGMHLQANPVKTFAQEQDLPVLQPASLRDEEVQKQILKLRADVFVVAAYGKIIPPSLLNFTYPAINIHASLLPRWRGAAPIERAIATGDTETGISIMQMSEGLDEGDVYLNSKTAIAKNENASELTERLAYLGYDSLITVLKDLITQSPEYKPRPQSDIANKKNIIYADKLIKSDGLVCFSESAQSIHNKVRAFSDSVGAYFIRADNSEKILIKKTDLDGIEEEENNNLPGYIIKINKNDVIVQCSDKPIRLITIQRSGKKAMSANALVNGLRLKRGDAIN